MKLFGWLKRVFKPGTLPIDPEKVESALGYNFNDRSLLVRSLKHRSYSQAVDGNVNLSNERLEFLGDSVLNMVVSQHIFLENPDFQEGELTKLRSSLVSKKSAEIAGKKLGIDQFVLLNDSEENTGGRSRSSIIADCFEAVIGAIYLDGGYEAAQDFITRSILENCKLLQDAEQTNYKSLLLELVQAEKLGHLVYRTISESGPEHNKIFTVITLVNSEPVGTGEGKSKKAAQQMSAKEGFETLMSRSEEKK